MKVVVIGGTGLIGSKTVERLRRAGHDVVAVAPQTGINSVTGEGLAEAVRGAQVSHGRGSRGDRHEARGGRDPGVRRGSGEALLRRLGMAARRRLRSR